MSYHLESALAPAAKKSSDVEVLTRGDSFGLMYGVPTLGRDVNLNETVLGQFGAHEILRGAQDSMPELTLVSIRAIRKFRSWRVSATSMAAAEGIVYELGEVVLHPAAKHKIVAAKIMNLVADWITRDEEYAVFGMYEEAYVPPTNNVLTPVLEDRSRVDGMLIVGHNVTGASYSSGGAVVQQYMPSIPDAASLQSHAITLH